LKDRSIVLIGGGGHCKSSIDVLESLCEYKIEGILDMQFRIGHQISGYRVIGGDDMIPEFAGKGFDFLVTVGQIKNYQIREHLFNKVKKSGGHLPTVISPHAIISKSAQIGEGTIVMPGVIINVEVRIGHNCILNTRALIEHESIIGNHCHISTGAIVNGQVQVGSGCFIGSNAMISNNISIAEKVIVSAGARLFKSIHSVGEIYKKL